MNRLTLVGRITRDIELRDIGQGRVVLNNTIAVKRHYRAENSPEADFIPFIAWGKRAELIEEYCQKGDLIGIDGRIQSRRYQNSEDETVYVVEMLVDDVEFLQPKKSEELSSNEEVV
jgi:single-strand DNA-binding protein